MWMPVRLGIWSIPLIFWFTASAYAERLAVRSYTGADGLADNHVNRIRQDSRGFIWIATDEGLSRFDGYTFTNYTTAHGLPHRWVNDLIETRHGDYWVATDGGVCHFDPTKLPSSNLAFRCYDPEPNNDARRVNALVEDPDGAIWCATYNGIYRMEIATSRVAFSHADVNIPAVYEGSLMNNLLFDRKGGLWVASKSGLYHRVSGAHWEHFSQDNGLPNLFIETLLEDQSGGLWIGTRSGGVCRLVSEPETAHIIVDRCYSTRDGLPANDVRSLLQTSDGNLWIATTGGLSQLQRHGQIVTYTTTNGLSDSTIYKLIEDRTGNIWIGTKNAGIMRLDRHGFVTYGEADGIRSGDYVSSIFEFSGRLCLVSGTVNHRLIQCFDGRKFAATELPIPSQLWNSGAGWYEGALADRDRSWWVPTTNGLYRFSPVGRVEDLLTANAWIVEGTRNKSFEFARQDQTGDVWIASAFNHVYGLLQWQHSTRKFGPFTGLPPSNVKIVSAVTRDSAGQLWFGFRVPGLTEDGGVVRCRDDSTSICEAIPGAPRGEIQTLYLDSRNRLWVGSSQGGVARIDNVMDAQPGFVAYYTTASGLSGNEVWSITGDRWGRIYVGTNHGLNQIDPSTGVIRYLTPLEGLAPGRIQAAYVDGGGILWFATHQAVSRLEPFRRSESAPQVRITGVRVSGAPLPLSALGETHYRNLQLGPSENSLQVDFVGIDLSPGSQLRYQVLMEDIAKDWSSPSETRVADFPRLPAGAHRLLVRAINADGVVSTEPASFAFTIALPLWRRWWFVSLAASGLVLTAYGVHRYRLARAVELANVRAGIATDLHDEIGSSLSRVAILSEVVQRQMESAATPDSARLLGDISATARGLVDAMSDVVWSIDPRRDDLRSLIARIREFASDMLEAKGIAWEFHTPEEIDRIRLSPEQRRDLYLIFKEGITNIVRHSGSRSAILTMKITIGSLMIQMRDDGHGFGADVPHGRGLTSIGVRAARMHGTCKIESSPAEGTWITVHVPLT